MRTLVRQQRTSDRQQRTSNKQQRTSDRQQRTSDKQKRTSDRQMRTSDKQKRTSDKQKRTSDKQKRTSDRQMRTFQKKTKKSTILNNNFIINRLLFEINLNQKSKIKNQMNDKQNAKLNMAQRVSDTFKRYENDYKNVPAMVSAVAALNTDINNIREVARQQKEVNVSAATMEKRAAERKMIVPCVEIANKLYVIGFLTDNTELITLQGICEHSFYNVSGNTAYLLARRVLNLATKHAEQLKDYGITENNIEETEQAIDAFQAIIAKPMDTIGERKQKTTNLAQLFAGLDSTFYDRLDKLMIMFKQPKPDFYGEYRTARNIIFQNEGKSAKKPADSKTSDIE